MMISGHPGSEAPNVMVVIAEEGISCNCVMFQELPLAIGDRVGLFQEVKGNADLAKVMGGTRCGLKDQVTVVRYNILG